MTIAQGTDRGPRKHDARLRRVLFDRHTLTIAVALVAAIGGYALGLWSKGVPVEPTWATAAYVVVGFALILVMERLFYLFQLYRRTEDLKRRYRDADAGFRERLDAMRSASGARDTDPGAASGAG
jgi:uncharacterized membrane protein YcjF (UPF0283 family)